MKEARRQERAEHEAYIARHLAPRDATKDEEGLTEQLVPALRPKLVQRLRRPGAVHHGRPGAGRVAEDGDGEERQEVVDHAEPGDEGAARQDVDRGREEEAGRLGDGREEDAPARGIADAGYELDGRVDEVEDEKADEEGAQGRAEERAAFLWPRGRWRVHALAKVPSEAAHGKHELEGILRPGRKEFGPWPSLSRRRIPGRIGVGLGGDGWRRHGARDVFALLVPACPGQGEIDALADEDEGEGGRAPVEHVVSWFEPDVAVG